MKVIVALAACAALSGSAFGAEVEAKVEKRCGYIENPTPANYFLEDADGSWLISAQGGYQAEGDVSDYPPDEEYVKTNVNYGYFCGCLDVTTDKAERKIKKIHKSKALKLDACFKDESLAQGYRPRKIVHSVGKAYTECLDANELQIGFRGRQACVNEAGEYYWLAN